MYIDTSGNKTYARHLLRESYQEGNKVKHKTIANISGCSEEQIAAIRLALRHKKDLSMLTERVKTYTQKQGLSIFATLIF